MIATVTVNPAVDKTLVVPGFAIGRTNRATVERVEPGGKGVNVARALSHLGCRVVATGFLAGEHGRLIAESLAAAGVVPDFISIRGETRVNVKVVDPTGKLETEINEPGCAVDAGSVQLLAEKIIALAAECAVIVMSGSLPPGVPPDCYATFIAIARRGGARTVLDASGIALKNGMAAAPDLVKPNLIEAEQILGTRIEGDAQLVRAAHRLLEYGPRAVVISLGAAGAVMASRAGVWRARPPIIDTARTVGAGDAMVAGFAYALAHDRQPDEALRLATAFSCAAAAARNSNISPDVASVHEFLPQVMIEPLTVRDATS
jgi:1-phosphofructokinase